MSEAQVLARNLAYIPQINTIGFDDSRIGLWVDLLYVDILFCTGNRLKH